MHKDQIFQQRLSKRMVDIFGYIFQSCSGRRYVLELLFLFHSAAPTGSCRNFH